MNVYCSVYFILLQNMCDGVLVWLSVWSMVQIASFKSRLVLPL